MRRVRVLAISMLCLVGMAQVAAAATWVLPPLAKETTDAFSCAVANTKPSALTVDVEIIGYNATTLTQQTLTVNPGEIGFVTYTGTLTLAYCKVTGGLSKAKTPTRFCVKVGSNLRCEATVSVP